MIKEDTSIMGSEIKMSTSVAHKKLDHNSKLSINLDVAEEYL